MRTIRLFLLATFAALVTLAPEAPSAQSQITLRARDGGFYVTAVGGGGPHGVLVANRTHAGEWETFAVEPTDDPERIALKSSAGFYVAAEGGGGGVAIANRPAVGAWEKWKPIPAGDGGYYLQAIDGHYLRAEGGGGGEINVRGPDQSAWQTFYPSAPLIRGPPPGAAFGIVGQLRLEPNGGFADDRGPVLPLFVHYGDAFSAWVHGRQAEVLAALDDIKRAEWLGIRFWSTLGGDSAFWAGRGVGPIETPGYYTHLEAFLTAVRARGLTVHLAQGDLRPHVVGDREQFVRLVAEVVRRVGPTTVALFEGLNEARDTGEPDPAKLAQFVQWFRGARPEPLVGLSSYTGTEDVAVLNAFSRAPADLYIVHSYRGGRWWDKARHIRNIVYDGHPHKRHGWNGEGPGVGHLVSAIDNKHEIDADVYALFAVMALSSRQGYVWFTGAGVINGASDRLQDMPGFWTVPAAVRSAVPADIMRYSGPFTHGGDTWWRERVFRAVGDVRADQVLHRDPDGTFRYLNVIYGPGDLNVPQDKPATIFSDVRFGNKARVVYGRAH